MTEQPTPVEMTAKDELDIQDFLSDVAETPTSRTVLEVWQHLLSNIEKSAEEKVSIHTANRLIMSWPQMKFSDLPKYHKRYHEILLEMRAVVTDQIEKNPDALKNVEDDAEANHDIYVEIIYLWQAVILKLEHNWDANDPDCAIEIAAIADAASMVIGNQGLVEHLSQIKLVFDEEQQAEVTLRLRAFQEAL